MTEISHHKILSGRSGLIPFVLRSGDDQPREKIKIQKKKKTWSNYTEKSSHITIDTWTPFDKPDTSWSSDRTINHGKRMKARNWLGVLTTLLKTVVKILLHVIKKTPIFIFADFKKLDGRKLNAHKHRHNANVYYYAYVFFPRGERSCVNEPPARRSSSAALELCVGYSYFFFKFIYTTLTTNRWGTGDLSSKRWGLFLQKNFCPSAQCRSSVWETFAKKYSTAPNNFYDALFSLYFFKKKKSQPKNIHLQTVDPPCHRKYWPGSSYLI